MRLSTPSPALIMPVFPLASEALTKSVEDASGIWKIRAAVPLMPPVPVCLISKSLSVPREKGGCGQVPNSSNFKRLASA